jgi:Glycosyltransferases involved in cell wall biogenesis
MKTSLSIIIPVYNEEENCGLLVDQIRTALSDLQDFEVILVNDGSKDKSGEILDSICAQDKRFKAVHFRRNFGQTAAMMAGIDYASGDIIISMDGDLQNDPQDIPLLLKKINEGYDVCSGWRKDRKDNPFNRKLPSFIANLLISIISGVKLKDYGCTLKAYKRDVIKDVKLYGEMHRFIPIYASWLGARVTEIPVHHHPRIHGKSKYGIKRTIKVFLDLLVVKFFASYLQSPIYIFGGFGMVNFLVAAFAFGAMIYYKYWGDKSFIRTPLPMIVTLFLLMGFMSILIGLVAELLMRTYYESQHKTSYLIHSTRNLENRF